MLEYDFYIKPPVNYSGLQVVYDGANSVLNGESYAGSGANLDAIKIGNSFKSLAVLVRKGFVFEPQRFVTEVEETGLLGNVKLLPWTTRQGREVTR